MEYSYKPVDAAAASSVVILKDGRALEVRRGEKTTWAAGEEQKCWSSLEEWRASLPADAEVTEKSADMGGGAQKYGTTFAELGLSADVEIWARHVGSESIKRLL